MRGWRNGVAIGKKYTRFTDPAHNAPAKKTAAKKTAPAKKAPAAKAAKTAPGKPITPPGNPAAKKAAPKPPAKKTASSTTPKPGHPITAPGHTPKASPPMTTIGTQALTEAIQAEIGGFEPKHATEVEAFIAGLTEPFTEFSNALSIVAERLSSEFPIDAAVADQLRQLAGHVATCGDWAQEAHRVFRLVHEPDLERHENPRPREDAWDVTTREN